LFPWKVHRDAVPEDVVSDHVICPASPRNTLLLVTVLAARPPKGFSVWVYIPPP